MRASPGDTRRAAEHAVWRILAATDEVELAAPRILEAVCHCGAWDLGELWVNDPRAGVLRLADLWAADVSGLEEFVAASRETTFDPGVGLPGRVFSTRRASWIEDVVDDPNFPRAPFARRAGLHAALAFPIKVHDDVTGVMSFYSPEFRQPDLDLLESLDVIGGQIGVVMARAGARRALAASEARWQRICEGAPIGIFHSLPDGRLLDANPAFATIFGFRSPAEALRVVNGTSIADALYAEPGRRAEILRELDERQGAWLRAEVQGRRVDGATVDVELHARRLESYQGEAAVIEGFVDDVTERRRMEGELRRALEQVRELSLRDPLTGVHNRRHLEECLAIELAAARRRRDDLALVIFDIDHFKAVNDVHGHAAGDAALRAFAATLAENVRPEDVFARCGGEEFVLLMRRTTCPQAVEAAERLRAAIAAAPVSLPDGTLTLTVSCGVASLAECAEASPSRLYGLADERLYRAKVQGRNRVVGES